MYTKTIFAMLVPGFHNRAVRSRQREPRDVEGGTTEQGQGQGMEMPEGHVCVIPARHPGEEGRRTVRISSVKGSGFALMNHREHPYL